jgi:hypothetical protein
MGIYNDKKVIAKTNGGSKSAGTSTKKPAAKVTHKQLSPTMGAKKTATPRKTTGGSFVSGAVTGATVGGAATKRSSSTAAKKVATKRPAPMAGAGSGANMTRMGGNIARNTSKKTY